MVHYSGRPSTRYIQAIDEYPEEYMLDEGYGPSLSSSMSDLTDIEGVQQSMEQDDEHSIEHHDAIIEDMELIRSLLAKHS